MKKLNLKLDDIKEMLTKEQMKKITGGYSSRCLNECGVKGTGNYVMCISESGDCHADYKNHTWISCDGTKYSCPAGS